MIMDRRTFIERRRRRKRVIAYTTRAIAMSIGIFIILLTVYGGLYICGFLSKNDKPAEFDAFANGESNAFANGESNAFANGESNAFTNGESNALNNGGADALNNKDETDINAKDDIAPAISGEDDVRKYCVVVDAGHGGIDGGTSSGEVIEKDINLSVALKLKAILEDNGIEVIMTRSSDEKVSLSERASIANDAKADFFISLHCNYFEQDNKVSGLECYYSSPEDAESKVYAGKIINAVSKSDEIKTRSAKAEGYYVLKNTQMPAVLVEMGFLSNDSECRKLVDDKYQETLSQKIAEGILQELISVSLPMKSAEYFHAISFPVGGFRCIAGNC